MPVMQVMSQSVESLQSTWVLAQTPAPSHTTSNFQPAGPSSVRLLHGCAGVQTCVHTPV